MASGPRIKITILGSGTSSGIPTLGCSCETCTSDDPKDNRKRSSVLLQSDLTTVIIDTSPDFREQMLLNRVDNIDGIIFTHHHFDHIGGFDDIRPFNFRSGKPLPIYLNQKTLTELKRTFTYAFEKPEQIGGGVPQISINLIEDGKFRIGDIELEIVPYFHGKLQVLGFRVNNFAYCTDTNYIPDESMEKLKDLDILVIDALRYHKHPTHFTIDEALYIIEILKPKKAFLTHISHQIKHRNLEKQLPENVCISYDGLELAA